MAKKHFILGGSNSGKSSFAEQTALDIKKKFSGDLYYIATGLAYDKEMKKKLLSIRVKEIQILKL